MIRSATFTASASWLVISVNSAVGEFWQFFRGCAVSSIGSTWPEWGMIGRFDGVWIPLIKENFLEFNWMDYHVPNNSKEFFEKPSTIVMFKIFKNNRAGSVNQLEKSIEKSSEIRRLIEGYQRDWCFFLAFLVWRNIRKISCFIHFFCSSKKNESKKRR